MATRKPQGKTETIESLLNAADQLFSEKGPNAVTVRDISARANVNHGLVHRHLGSKEALLSEVLDRHMHAFKAALVGIDSPERAVRTLRRGQDDRPAFVRMLAFLILERRSTDEFTRTEGGTADFAAILRNAGFVSDSARSTAALLSAFSLGWALYKDFVIKAAGCEETVDRMDERATDLLLTLIRGLSADAAAQTAPRN